MMVRRQKVRVLAAAGPLYITLVMQPEDFPHRHMSTMPPIPAKQELFLKKTQMASSFGIYNYIHENGNSPL
jgi:hypothetical protein